MRKLSRQPILLKRSLHVCCRESLSRLSKHDYPGAKRFHAIVAAILYEKVKLRQIIMER